MSIHIKNGLFIDPVNLSQTKTDIYIDGNLIVGVGTAPDDFKASQTIDASNQWLIPGLVDCQVRLREPGQVHKGTIESETQAAIAGQAQALRCAHVSSQTTRTVVQGNGCHSVHTQTSVFHGCGSHG